MEVVPTSRSSNHRTRFVWILFFIASIASAWALTRQWGGTIRSSHEFRQAQTALSTYYMERDGFKLDYETPVLGPPWSIPMEFPSYQVVTIVVSRITGLPLVQSGRLAGILAFYATLPAIWLLLRRRLPDTRDRLLVITSILLCPIYLFYTRAILIESTALCLSLWFLFFFDKNLDQIRGVTLLAAWFFGAAAAATKITTFAALGVVMVLLVAERIASGIRTGESWSRALRLPTLRASLAAIGGITAGGAWVVYSDRLKADHPYGQFITSASLREFNLGTIAQRFSGTWWREIWRVTSEQVISLPSLAILFIGLLFVSPMHRRLAVGAIASFLCGLLLFANLYYIHDYYYYASAFFMLTAFGIVAGGLLARATNTRWLIGIAVVVALGFQGYRFQVSYYKHFLQEDKPMPAEADLVREITPAEDVVAGFGFDWNSLWPFSIERRGIFPFQSKTLEIATFERSLSMLEGRSVSTLMVAAHLRTHTPLTDALIFKLKMTPHPILQTKEMDIYVHRDLGAASMKKLQGRQLLEGMVLEPTPGTSLNPPTTTHDLTTEEWRGRFTMTSPRPAFSKGEEFGGIFPVDDIVSIATQAPTEIYFDPPPGSTSISAVTGMLRSSYTEGHTTPGVVVSIFEEMPDGRRRSLFERMLNPLNNPGDRGDVTITINEPNPFTGRLVFAHYSGPSGNISYSWGYWKLIKIK